ncbi:MAG TPA: polysaccharide biosynthesis/export family protein [Steroidobacteraceae bacterium]|nr:polysaccharide biosynthesis/export family protein [Steroidobacteraceae bacterium]
MGASSGAEAGEIGLRDMRAPEAPAIDQRAALTQGAFRVRIRSATLRLWLSAVLAVLAGCTDILPGMNIHTGGPGLHAYGTIPAPSSTGARKVLSYRVMPITPEVLSSLLTHADPLDDPPAGAPPLKPLLPSTVPPDYRVGPGDLLSITVWDHPELNAPAGPQSQNVSFDGELVAADGTIYYPYVGTFKVAGMTERELREYVTDHLSGVIQRPQVGVRVVSYGSERVEITGEVMHPGTVTLGNVPLGILQAIDAAGGLSPSASRRRAILVRHGVRYQIDLAGLLSGSRLVPNPELEPGDDIHIPDQSADEVFMLGAVNGQRPLTLTQASMTLMAALTSVGGLDNTQARGSGVLVFRLKGHAAAGPEAIIYTINMSTPQGVLLASQFQLRPFDVVYVQATAFAQYNSVINALLPTVTSVFELSLIPNG